MTILMLSKVDNIRSYSFQPPITLEITLNTLMQSYKRTPNLFTLVQKVKISYLFFLYLYINQGFAEALKVISFQNDL